MDPSPDSQPPTLDLPLAFEVADVHKSYTVERHDVPVLQGVSFAVPRGSWTALVGRSGSGKTTLLHLLGCLDNPSSGTIACLGQHHRRIGNRGRTRLRRQEIGFVFQSYHLFPELNALENVLLPALHYGRNHSEARARAEELLNQFGLGDRLRHRPQELSGGEQQRVALSRALINDPSIILADEPTGNLDVTASADIMQILRDLHTGDGKTIVMVTHDLQLATEADTCLVLRNGQAVQTDTDPNAIAALLADPPAA